MLFHGGLIMIIIFTRRARETCRQVLRRGFHHKYSRPYIGHFNIIQSRRRRSAETLVWIDPTIPGRCRCHCRGGVETAMIIPNRTLRRGYRKLPKIHPILMLLYPTRGRRFPIDGITPAALLPVEIDGLVKHASRQSALRVSTTSQGMRRFV